MLIHKLNLIPFFDANDSTGTGVLEAPGGEINKDDILDFLKDESDDDTLDLKSLKFSDSKDKKDKKDATDKDEKDEKEEKKEPSEDETEEERVAREEKEAEEKDELDELEDDLEEPTDEQLKLTTPVPRREILKKYPQLFKDFPYLQTAYYREREFTELFPEIGDAKAAIESKEVLEKFEEDLMSGNTKLILQSVKDNNPRSFNKIVDNYLDVLGQVDNQARLHIIENTIKHTILEMYNVAKETDNEELQAAAAELNKFIFNTTKFKPPTKLSSDDDKGDTREAEIERERQEFLQERFETARDDLDTRVNNTIKNAIINNIDPKGSMTEYVKRAAISDAQSQIEDLISRDNRFKSLVDKLWDRSFKANFSKQSLDDIKSAFHSKAKMLLPSVIKKARVEALRGMGKRVKSDDKESDSTPDKKSHLPPGRPQSPRSGKITKATDIPKGMTTREFLEMD